MMSNRIIKTLYPFVFGILLFTFLFISCSPRIKSNSSVIEAVPFSSPIFLKINDAAKLGQILDNQNEWWKLLGNIGNLKSIQKQVSVIDSIIKGNSEFKRLIGSKEIVFSLNSNEKNGIDVLTIIPLNRNGDQSLAESVITEFIKTHQLLSKKRKYNKISLYELTSINVNSFNYTYTFFRDFLIFSSKASLVEESIRQFDSKSREKDVEFASLLKTINNQAEVNIFINHQIANEIFSTLLSDRMKNKVLRMKDYSSWTELDATFKDEKIFISGFSNGNEQSNYFSNILLHQKPGESKIESVLPSDIDYFSSFYLSDIGQFFKDYKNFLIKLNLNLQNQEKIKVIEEKTGFNLEDLFVEIADKEIAETAIRIDPSITSPSKILIVKTKSGSFALKKMKDFQVAYFNSEKKTSTELEKDFKIDNQTNIEFYKFPIEKMPVLLFGNLFSEMKANWFAVYNNYLIFADSYAALGKIILSNVLGETLITNNDYINFQAGLTSKNNYYFFCNSAIAFQEANLFFNNEISNDIISNSNFAKFKYIAWQVSSSGNMIYNNASILYNPNLTVRPQTVWQSHLASSLCKKPLIVKNRYDQQDDEIILADSKNNVYMLNNIGRIVWQINVGSPILSDIQLIDINKNEDYQLIFNTKEKLFIVDKRGNDLQNFPVSFRVNATNGVSVFDYEKNKNYRFFIAAEDQMIYAYDAEGKLLEGWQPFKTDHIVSKPLQHFAIDGKDYIVASDQMKDYIFDRKGNIRVLTDVVYQHSKNNTLCLEKRTSMHEPRLVTTDSKGNIHRTYFDGSHDTLQTNELNDSHFFLAANVDEDDELEYLYVQGNQIIVQKNDGNSMFNQIIECEISNKPSVFKFSSKEKKIGVCCSASNKIFLYNSNGTLYSGFPLDGCSEFNIGFNSEETSNFNVLVGTPDGYLYNYMVK
jgi:hypothetical protein